MTNITAIPAFFDIRFPRVLDASLKEPEGIDRMYLNVYVRSCSGNKACRVSFGFTGAHPCASGALMDPSVRRLRRRWKRSHVFIGRAQEKMPVFRTERRRSEATGVTYPWLVRSTAMVNQFYIYCVDRDFGPFFLK
jgi:hypothetical protein